jgi:hypothetical protein
MKSPVRKSNGLSSSSARLLLVCLCVQSVTAGWLKPPTCASSQVKQKTSPLPTTAANSKRLWPESKFTEADRQSALARGLQFIYRTALDESNFRIYGADYLWCFYTISAAVSDPATKRTARRMGIERAREWRRQHRSLPADANVATIADYVFGSDAADSLGVRDDRVKAQIRRAIPRFTARDYLLFDPLTEPPPTDMPRDCAHDRSANPRGRRFCRFCQLPLKMRTPQDVWYDALVETYTAEHYGVVLGARYTDVLKWLPQFRPYRGYEDGANPNFHDTVYAVTHIVYTLNNYSQSRLSPELLPQEYEFLRDAERQAARQGEDDMLGETMDTIRAFGVTRDDPDMRAGMEYYLTHQNPDGSWGKMSERDIYDRYHPTWNAIAGLSEYLWRTNRLSFPNVRPLLEEWNRPGEKGARANQFPPFNHERPGQTIDKYLRTMF